MVSCLQELCEWGHDDAEMGCVVGGTGSLLDKALPALSPSESDFARTLPNIRAKSYYFLIYLVIYGCVSVFVAAHQLWVAVNEGYSSGVAWGLIIMVVFYVAEQEL